MHSQQLRQDALGLREGRSARHEGHTDDAGVLALQGRVLPAVQGPCALAASHGSGVCQVLACTGRAWLAPLPAADHSQWCCLCMLQADACSHVMDLSLPGSAYRAQH